MRLPLGLILTLILVSGAATAGSLELIEKGDSAYQHRADGHDGARARAEPIEEAVRSYGAALELEPDNRLARWKLLRSLYFKAEYTLSTDEAKLAIFQEAIDIADDGRARLLAGAGIRTDEDELEPEEIASALADESDAAEIYFWSAAHWGLWGKYKGKIAAARQGVATRVRDYAEVTALLDETIEEAGGHRILGRLHTEAPRLPFVTGWVDPDEAVSRLELAAEIDNTALLTKVFLAEALLEFRPARRTEAISLLEAVAASSPDPAMVVEETKTIEDARAVLASLR